MHIFLSCHFSKLVVKYINCNKFEKDQNTSKVNLMHVILYLQTHPLLSAASCELAVYDPTLTPQL